LYEIKTGRIKPKKESTFGKKPYVGKNRNRTGRTAKTVKVETRNPLVLRGFYVYVRDIANGMGCDAHHWLPKSKLKQDIFLALVPFDEHRAIHAEGNYQSPMQWAEVQGVDLLVENSMQYFEDWAINNCLPDEYFILIEQLKNNPFDYHDIARDFILENRNLKV